ncbi:hypothetical protein OF83DRAFT_1146842, partial [Amylostereum chailletii]
NSQFTAQKANLVSWIDEIITAAWAYQQTNGTLLNDIDLSSSKTFADSSTTAIIAAMTYRLATVTGDTRNMKAAEKAYSLIV